MKISGLTAIVLASALLATGSASAQQPQAAAPKPMEAVPEKMPFNTPYGAPISLGKAQAAIAAAIAEANKRGWQLNVAVVDSGGNLVTFARMDGSTTRVDRDLRTQSPCGSKISPANKGF